MGRHIGYKSITSVISHLEGIAYALLTHILPFLHEAEVAAYQQGPVH